ncbi:MAG: galactonate dehydratase [Bdellovibrionales bacterium]|nr:galactonate dehydratase [Bdellovibrionales bacterium]
MKPDKVQSFELFKIPPRWLLLRVVTEQGVVGWGEPNLEGFSDTVAAAVIELMEEVIGEDPARIQFIWQKLCKTKFYGGTGNVLMSAVAGIDQALWDIQGKTLGVPVHRLLGGAVRERMLVYRWCGGDNNAPEEAAAEAAQVIAETNFRNIKMNACPRMGYIDTDGAVKDAERRMAAVREAVGPEIGVGLDFHGRCKAPMARSLMAALEPYRPLFFEEVVAPHCNSQLPGLRQATAIPLATGERMFSAPEFLQLLSSGGADILQPDLSHAGGISHVFDIARMAEQYDVALAPHCPLGPIALASCLQVDFCSINAVFQECSLCIHYNTEGGADLLDYVVNREVFDVDAEGYIALPQTPGLGVEIDETAVRNAAKKGHRWRDRVWLLPDGAPTKW